MLESAPFCTTLHTRTINALEYSKRREKKSFRPKICIERYDN